MAIQTKGRHYGSISANDRAKGSERRDSKRGIISPIRAAIQLASENSAEGAVKRKGTQFPPPGMSFKVVNGQIDPKTQSYINNFRRNIFAHLKPNTGMRTSVFPYPLGSVMKMEFVDNLSNIDEATDVLPDVKTALAKADLHLENKDGQPLENPKFSGTSILLTENKAFIIKDKTDDEWTEQKAKQDVKKIISI